MPQTITRQARRVVDHAGRRLVHVPLKGGATALLNELVYDRITKPGSTPRWFFNGDGKGNYYVKASVPGPGCNLIMVARLVLDVPQGKVVRYASGNHLDLTLENLTLGGGFAKRRELAAKPDADADADEGYLF